MASQEDVERFYARLREAGEVLPADIGSFHIRGEFDFVVLETASILIDLRQPKSMADVRAYWAEDRLLGDLAMSYLLQRAPQANCKELKGWLDDLVIRDYIPIEQMLSAPAETPEELAAWVIAEERRLLDKTKKCSRCKRLIPFDDLAWSSIGQKRTYYHNPCIEMVDQRPGIHVVRS